MKVNVYQIVWQDYDDSKIWLFLHVDAHGKEIFEQHIYQVIKDHIDEYLQTLPEYNSQLRIVPVLDFISTKMIKYGYTFVSDEEITQVFVNVNKFESLKQYNNVFLGQVVDFVIEKHQQYNKSKK